MAGHIPYGYKIVDAKLIEDKEEVQIVQAIYDLYKEKGTSYQTISEIFNKKPECNNRWTKSRIKRLLEDKRYLGDGFYTQIISEEIFYKVQEIKLSRNKNILSLPDVETIKAKSICSECGQNIKRHTKTKNKTTWYCSDCQVILIMEDEEIKEKITAVINRVKEDNRLLQAREIKNNHESIEKIRIKNEIKKEFEKRQFNADAVLELMNAMLQISYDEIDGNCKNETTAYIEQKLSYVPRLEEFNSEIFNEVIDKILIDSERKMYARFINGKTIEIN